MKVYTAEEIEEALRIARASTSNIADTLSESGCFRESEINLYPMFSFERTFRASLRLDDSEGRGGRAPITNKGGKDA